MNKKAKMIFWKKEVDIIYEVIHILGIGFHRRFDFIPPETIYISDDSASKSLRGGFSLFDMSNVSYFFYRIRTPIEPFLHFLNLEKTIFGSPS